MKITLRKFKHKQFLLLIAEGPQESILLDAAAPMGWKGEPPVRIQAVLTSDDTFTPYLRIEVPKK